jgi:hypothetical protein
MQPRSSFKFRSFIVCAFWALSGLSVHPAAAADDNFDGAVWKFEMTNKKDPAKKLFGRFRVSNHVLFQKDTPSDPKYSKQVGKNFPDGKKTRFEVSDFRVLTPNMSELKVKGTARLTLVKVGEWEGLFTDGRGVNWDFKASRIQE